MFKILRSELQEHSNVWPISACLWVMCHTPLTKTKANGFPLSHSLSLPFIIQPIPSTRTLLHTHTHHTHAHTHTHTHTHAHTHTHTTPISLVKCVAKVGSSAEQQMSSGRSMEVKNGEKKKIFKNLLLCRSSKI